MKILVVEDDRTFGDIMRRALEREGYFVDVVTDGEKGLYKVRVGNYALVILDIKLPHKNGFEVCRELRRDGNNIPILMITAMSEEFGVATGLDLGADDYLRKPFELAELFARIRALIRREHGQKKAYLEYGPFSIDTRAHRVFFNENQEIKLNPKEYKLLTYLIHYVGQAVSVSKLVENIWGEELVNVNSNSLEVYIHRIRNILKKHGMEGKLITVRGFGYELLEPNQNE